MSNRQLVALAAERLPNRAPRTEAADRAAFSRIVAGSHRLEGIDTLPEEVLEAADAQLRVRTGTS